MLTNADGKPLRHTKGDRVIDCYFWYMAQLLDACPRALRSPHADTTLLQSTNYWKNAAQQGLPFTMNPAVLYRGYMANTLNNGFCVMS